MVARRHHVEESAGPGAAVLRARARHVAHSSRLDAIGAALSRAVTPEEVARTVVERTLGALAAQEGGVWSFDAATGEARLVFGAGLGPGAPPHWEGRTAGAGAGALRRGEPVFTGSHAGPEARWRAAGLRDGAPPREEHAVACLPLQAEGRVIGGASFAFRGPHRFDHDEQVFLAVVARLAAQALLRAELHESLRAARAEAKAARGLAAFLADEGATRWEEAQRAIRVRDEVLAVVSHDLKNPLESVLLCSSLLLRSPESPRVHRYAEALRRSATRMDRLIRELLDLSRMDAGRFRVDARPERLEAIVEEALALVAPLAAEKRITLTCAGGPLAAEVPCDRERVLQVLSNLVGNALQFTPGGGHVTVGVALHARHAEVAVSDDGPGIPPEDLPHLFDRYWKSRSRHGTGLGLAIVRGVVDAHGGRIRVESRMGEGTTFTFTLPR